LLKENQNNILVGLLTFQKWLESYRKGTLLLNAEDCQSPLTNIFDRNYQELRAY